MLEATNFTLNRLNVWLLWIQELVFQICNNNNDPKVLETFWYGFSYKKYAFGNAFACICESYGIASEENDTITVKKRYYTDYNSFKQVGCLSGVDQQFVFKQLQKMWYIRVDHQSDNLVL